MQAGYATAVPRGMNQTIWLERHGDPGGWRVLCESFMIHSMAIARATIRDLRTKFPRLKEILAREGEVLVTDRGRPAYVLRAYAPPPRRKSPALDYFARLKARQPRPLSKAAARALDDHERGER